jgi:hypothetical protein
VTVRPVHWLCEASISGRLIHIPLIHIPALKQNSCLLCTRIFICRNRPSLILFMDNWLSIVRGFPCQVLFFAIFDFVIVYQLLSSNSVGCRLKIACVKTAAVKRASVCRSMIHCDKMTRINGVTSINHVTKLDKEVTGPSTPFV